MAIYGEAKKPDGGPAFPTEQGYDYRGERVVSVSPGMTLRDYFAGQALAGIVSKLPFGVSSVMDGSEKELRSARGAWSYADAMLAERDK